MAHTIMTGSARKAANVPYPLTYAPEDIAVKGSAAYKFNCTQRAHANFLENQPSIIVLLLVSGVYYPNAAAWLGGIWSAARLVYGIGYSRGGPDARM